MEIELIIKKIIELSLVYVPKIIIALIIWFVGKWVIKLLVHTSNQILDRRNIDPTLRPFVKAIINTLLKVMLVISVLGTVGIQMTSFVAIIGAAGLAIGMALSGTLQNFAGSVIILIFRPYKVGDFIEAEGYKGIVNEIHIFHTILKTLDNKTVIIPNGKLSNSAMTNFTTEPLRRVDWIFGIAYGDDYDKAKEVITRYASEDDRIKNEPPVFIALSELGDSSVNITVRAWVDAPEYWNVYFLLNEKVYRNFAKEGLNIPFPQMDVHVHQNN